MKLGILREESGQGMVEYGLILVLIALGAIGALTGLGGIIQNVYDGLVKGLKTD